jgi:hypothetical protein
MSLLLDGTNGITFNNATTQNSGGKVLQVVNATYNTQVGNSTSTYADTGLTASITPLFSTSKILIMVSHPQNTKTPANSNNDLAMNICRSGSQIVEFAAGIGYTGTAINLIFSTSFNYLDSPATTSSTTYKTQFKNADNNGAAVYVQSGALSSITLMEIAA